MDKQPLHIVHLGISGFPYGFGAMQRLLLLYRGLAAAGAKIQVINKKGVFPAHTEKEVHAEGEFKGIPYVYTSPQPFRQPGFVKRNLHKLAGWWGEFRLLRKKKKAGTLDAAMVYLTGQFLHLFYYRLLTWWLGIPLILNYVEYRSAFPNRKGLTTRLNDWLFDHYCGKLSDAVLPISDFLVDILENRAPKTPQLKVPVICDFDAFDVERNVGKPNHFLYCGAASYFELVDFTLTAYEKLGIEHDFELHLVLGGKDKELARVKKRIQEVESPNRIRLFENVPHREVPHHLANATALLIPMRPSVQDEARFPHKVGEYLASGTALITNNFGEIQYYFQDGENGYVAPDYEIGLFTAMMQRVIDKPDEAVEIGQKGREMGIREFNYLTFGKSIYQLIGSLRPLDNKNIATQTVVGG